MTFVTGITNSCDVVFYSIGKGFYYSDTQEGMQETFRRYGLGSAAGIDLPGEMSGRVPDAEWKWNYFTSSSDEARAWQGGDNCNLAIGQGDLLVTCLQMVDAYCGIANNGTIWRPHLLKSVKARTGEGSVIDYKPAVIYEPTEDATYRDTVCQGLHGVVYEEAASQAVHWTNLDVDVAGKTGTYYVSSLRETRATWFIGATKQIATAVVLTGGEQGLSDLGQHEAACERAQEAVELRRQLIEQRPEVFQAGLAMSLNNLANRLRALGQHEAACARAQTAAASSRSSKTAAASSRGSRRTGRASAPSSRSTSRKAHRLPGAAARIRTTTAH